MQKTQAEARLLSISLRYSPHNALDGIFLSADAARQLSLYPITLGALGPRGSHHDAPEKRIR